MLRQFGYNSLLFPSAEAFANQIDFEQAICVLLDINLGDVSGVELRLRLKAADNSVPVIYMTGNDSPAVRTSALQSGCLAYLTKPFSAKSLMEPPRESFRRPDAAQTIDRRFSLAGVLSAVASRRAEGQPRTSGHNADIASLRASRHQHDMVRAINDGVSAFGQSRHPVARPRRPGLTLSSAHGLVPGRPSIDLGQRQRSFGADAIFSRT